MNILRKYYKICAEILKEELPLVPPMKLTNAKSYRGQITKTIKTFDDKTESYEITIQLSKFNLYASDFCIRDEDIEQIIKTICHEFAHLTQWNHSWEHDYLIQKYMRRVVNKIGLESSIYYKKVS